MQIWPCLCALESGDAVRDAGIEMREAGKGEVREGFRRIKDRKLKLELKIILPFGPRPKA